MRLSRRMCAGRPRGPSYWTTDAVISDSFPRFFSRLGSLAAHIASRSPSEYSRGTICRSPDIPSGHPLLLHCSAYGLQVLPSPQAPGSLSSTQGDPRPCLAIPRSVGAWKLSLGSGPEYQRAYSACSRHSGITVLSCLMSNV